MEYTATMQPCVLVNGSCRPVAKTRARSIARPAVSWTHVMDWTLVAVTGLGAGLAGILRVMAAVR